jgi:hypothetical protein
MKHDDDDQMMDEEELRELLGWGNVRAGLALTFFGGLLFGLCLLLFVSLQLTTDPSRGYGASGLAASVGYFSVLGIVAGGVLLAAGGCMGCGAPVDSGVRGWGVAYSVCLALVLVLGTVLFVALQSSRADPYASGPMRGRVGWTADEVRGLGYTLYALAVVVAVFYLLMLRAAARFFGRDGLAVGVIVYLVVVVLALAGFLYFLHNPPRARGYGSNEVYLFGAGAVFIVLFVWGLLVVGYTRAAITNGILKG